MSKLSVSGILTALCLASCAESDLGSGANTINREYSKPASDIWTASMKSTEAVGLTCRSERHDKMGGEIVASRANGDEVRIEVKSLSETTSRVSVRVQPGDRNLANMIQERIADKVGLGAAKSGLFGGNSLNAPYPTDLSSSAASARHTFSALEVTTTGEDAHATWINLDGRLHNSTPVRIRMEKIDEVKTQVTFIAGNEKNADNKDFAQKMKDEFEKGPTLKGSGN